MLKVLNSDLHLQLLCSG